MIRLFLTMFLALAMTAGAAAQSSSDQPHTSIRLIAESAKPAPGQPLTLGLVLTPKDGWHTYWSNPGDAGAPTRVKMDAAAWHARAPCLAYPLPETLIVSGLMNYVYSHPNTLITTIVPPADLKKGDAFPVTVKADWLVCSMEQCVPKARR